MAFPFAELVNIAVPSALMLMSYADAFAERGDFSNAI
jgi:hypothetical protein